MRAACVDIIKLFTNKDIFLNILICIVWGSMLLAYMRGVVNHLPVLNNFTDEIEAACVVIPLLLALPAILSRLTLFDYIFYFALVLMYLCNYVIHPMNAPWLNDNILSSLFMVYPLFFVGRLLDIDRYYNAFVAISAVCVMMSIFYFFHYAQANKDMNEVAGSDNMYTAYRALPHVAMLLWASMRKFNLITTALTFIGVVFLLSCGTRGPLFCLAVFGVVYFMFFISFRYSAIVKILIVAIASSLLLFLNDIIFYFVRTFTNLNLSTRILEKFVTGDIGNDTGRAELRAALLRYDDVYGDFFGIGYFGSERFGYVYVHHVVYDFFFSYGYVLGTLLLLALLALLALGLFLARSKTQRAFVLLMCTLAVVKLFLSGTFLTESFFYVLIGYCVSIIMNERMKIVNE